MKGKATFVFSIICVTIAILSSFFIICSSFAVLEDAKKLLCSAESEIQKLYEIKESAIDESVGDVTEEKHSVTESEEDIVIPEIKKESLGEFKLTAYCSCEKC